MRHKYVFISYSSDNKAVADTTYYILEKCGISCWTASHNIIPDNTWAGNIVQTIRECSLIVLIYSENSNSSSQVANEVDKAFSHNKTIIPFMVDSTSMNNDFNYYLSRKYWLIAYPGYKEILMPLVEAVATNIRVEIQSPQPKIRIEPACGKIPGFKDIPSTGHQHKMAVNGLAYDKQCALELYHRTLNEGHLEAFHNIACYYLFDMATSMRRDKTEIRQGISLLHKSIEYGVAICLPTLAFCDQRAIRVPENVEKAFRRYKKAAEAGALGSYFKLGSMYYCEKECQKNDIGAWVWIVRESKIPNGNCCCCYQLGLMYQNGHDQRK